MPEKRPYFPLELPKYNTSRSWIQYIINLQIDQSMVIPGSMILDIGGSGKPEFDSSNKHFPGVQIISIDPAYIISDESAYDIEEYNDWQLKILQKNHDPQVTRKIGVVQNIPVENFSMDFIWSNIAVPLYIDDDEVKIMWSEIIRVAAPNAEIRLYPISTERQQIYINIIRRYGYQIDLFEHKTAPNEDLRYGVRIKVPNEEMSSTQSRYKQLENLLKNIK